MFATFTSGGSFSQHRAEEKEEDWLSRIVELLLPRHFFCTSFGDGLTMNVELMVLTMNMEARLTMVEDGDGVAEVMNVVTRRGHQPTLAPPPALSISIHRMLPSSSSRAQLWQL